MYITSAAQTLLAGMGGHGRSWDESGGALLAPELFGEAGVTPQDIDVVGFYDHFSPVIITKLEDYGFCQRGEGGPFVEGAGLEWAENCRSTLPAGIYPRPTFRA